MEAAEFGPMITRTFEGTSQKGRTKGTTRKMEVTFPEWCQITIWRVLNGNRIQFVSPKVYWLEAYGKWTDTDVPNDMWGKRPVGQVEKCAEAAGLRRAFPEEIGNDYAAEEMEGQRLGFVASGEKVREGASLADRLKANASGGAGFDATSSVTETGTIIDAETGEVIDADEDNPPNAAGTAPPLAGEQAGPEPQTKDPAASGPVTEQAKTDGDDFLGDRPAPDKPARKFIRSDLRKGEE
jgi:hypothetical protein